MKIACLQFAPQVGDVDNNLNRADSILNKAKAEDLQDMDLLVLPELAFSGYNFKSLQHITPYLEPPGSGISSLWARTTALKYDCAVVVGYPEKVDVSVKWPASPEYYNSALIVNGDGDTIANYRKSFLYYMDETWALEGKERFFQGEIPGVGHTALGICMDLNPYRFEAPWDAFEFGFHALESEANVVILTMAWTTQQDAHTFSQRPQDPDIEALVYWVQRLEPLIRADREGEVIVVFCNRAGTEDDVTYAGTSAVLGILEGEVYVYGVLGRGVKDILVVDTDHLPMSKLTDTVNVETEYPYTEEIAEYGELDTTEPAEFPSPTRLHSGSKVDEEQLLEEESAIILEDEDDGLSPLTSNGFNRPQQWAPLPGRVSNLRSQLKLVIPTGPAINDPTPIESAIDDDIIIDSPGLTSPIIHHGRLPKLTIPSSPWRFRKKPSPYPWQQSNRRHPQIFGGGKVCMTPITPFDTGSPIISAKLAPQSAGVWRPTQSVFKNVPEPIPEDEVQVQVQVQGQDQGSASYPRRLSLKRPSYPAQVDSSQKFGYQESKEQEPQSLNLGPHGEEEGSDLSLIEDGSDDEIIESDPPSEEEKEVVSPVADLGQLSAILEGLRLAQGCTPLLPDSRPPPPPYEPSQSPSQSPCPDRPYSPKSVNASRNGSRNPSRSRLMELRDLAFDERTTSISRGTIPISASPSVFDADHYRPQSIPITASPSIFSNTDAMNSPIIAPVGRPVSRLGHRVSKPSVEVGKRLLGGNSRSLSLPAVHETKTHIRSASIAGYRDIGTNGHKRRRSSLRISTTNLNEPTKPISRDGSTKPTSRDGSRSRPSRRNTSQTGKSHRRRNVSRGRQPAARGTSVDRSNSVGESRSQVSRRQSLQSRQHSTTETPKSISQRRTRTCSARAGRRQSTPLFKDDPAKVAPAGDTDTDTEIEASDLDVAGAGAGGNDDDVFIGSIKRIAPDCPHHSPFRRSSRQRQRQHSQSQSQHDTPVQLPAPPPPLLPTDNPASLMPFPKSESVLSSGGGLLSASSVEGFMSETTCSPMSPETPRFFGGGGSGGVGVEGAHRTTILSELISTSTVTSPSEQMKGGILALGGDGYGSGNVGLGIGSLKKGEEGGEVNVNVTVDTGISGLDAAADVVDKEGVHHLVVI